MRKPQEPSRPLARPRRAARAPAAIALAVAVGLSACTAEAGDSERTPRIVQPGAPGETSRVLEPGEAPEIVVPEHTEADVRFMHMMIAHHEQALVMTALVPERTSREDVPLFARRIELSQADEIEYMRNWLAERDEPPPGGHDHGDVESMPGMLTDAQLAELEAAGGAEFDRLFLEYMYYHHTGALEMVQDLFAVDGAGEEPEIWRLANDIDSDQRIELARIETMLAEFEDGPSPP